MNKNVIFIDGQCMMCNSFAMFVHNRDVKKKFYFSTLQGDLLQKLTRNLEDSASIESSSLRTIIFYYDGLFYYKSTAVLKILEQLPSPWSYTAFLIKCVPVLVRDFIYDVISKLRYALFEKKSSCGLPEQSLKDRIL